ncbi:MAG: hypothetical protein ACQEVA_14565 [Myxococcota bacterium]
MPARLAAVVFVLLALSGCGSCGAGADGAPWQIEEHADVGEAADTRQAPDLDSYDAGPSTECGDTLPEQHSFSPAGGDAVQARVTIGPGGCPHVGYFENGTVYYARWGGERWHVESVATTGPNNWEFDLAVGADGRPHFVHESGSGDVVRYAYRNSSGDWTSSVVDQFFMWNINLQITPDGRPAFLAVRTSQENTGTDPRLLYYVLDSDEWTSTEVLAARQALNIRKGLRYDTEGRPVVAVAGGSSNDAIYVAHPGRDGTWQRETIEAERFAASSAMLALDSDDDVRVLFCGFSDQRDLKLVAPTQSGLMTQTAFELEGGCLPGGAVFDASQRLHVLVNRVHAVYEDGGWRQFRLDALEHDGPQYISTAFDVARGTIHVVTIEDTGEPQNRDAIYRTLPLDPEGQ